jgi:hypothetical protein
MLTVTECLERARESAEMAARVGAAKEKIGLFDIAETWLAIAVDLTKPEPQTGPPTR